jgi:hypothetical protein
LEVKLFDSNDPPGSEKLVTMLQKAESLRESGSSCRHTATDAAPGRAEGRSATVAAIHRMPVEKSFSRCLVSVPPFALAGAAVVAVPARHATIMLYGEPRFARPYRTIMTEAAL